MAHIGAPNFFELAVAASISLFGFNSGAALATVVGVLVEVPVMLLVVRISPTAGVQPIPGLMPGVRHHNADRTLSRCGQRTPLSNTSR